jgi:phosphoribosylaminoimidazolecarboxamide formyltransferase/IMP cyclohydrolase
LAAKKNLRVLLTPIEAEGGRSARAATDQRRRPGSGGRIGELLDEEKFEIVSERKPTQAEMRGLRLGWAICKHVKSNAIVYAAEHQLVGVGAGQMSRVDSVRIGAMKAQLPLSGSVLASDAFFPFRDGLDEAASHGITAVIQPGGSVRDKEVIQAANEHGIAMVFTPACAAISNTEPEENAVVRSHNAVTHQRRRMTCHHTPQANAPHWWVRRFGCWKSDAESDQ